MKARTPVRGLLESGEVDLMVVRSEDRKQFESFIEEVPYEIESDDTAGLREEEEPAQDGADATITLPGDRPLPTLEEAERQLIDEALRRFGALKR